MSQPLSLQRFTTGDPAYIDKMNANAALTELALNLKAAALMAEGPLVRSVPPLMWAVLGLDRVAILQTLVPGADGAMSTIVGTDGVRVQLDAGLFWLPSEAVIVYRPTAWTSERLTTHPTLPRYPPLPSPLPIDQSYFEAHQPWPYCLHVEADGTVSISPDWSATPSTPPKFGGAFYAIDFANIPTFSAMSWRLARTVKLDFRPFAKGPAPHDLRFHLAGRPTAGGFIGLRKLARAVAVPPGLAGSTVVAGTNPASPALLTVKTGPRAVDVSGGTTVATATLAPDGSVSFESYGFQAAAGDVVAVFGPMPADAVLADVALTIAATLV